MSGEEEKLPLPVDEVDIKARLRAAKVIHEKFKNIVNDVLKGRPPKLVIRKRTLSNIDFDPERGILLLGEETLEREFLNLNEARRFMQTLLMASIIYQALIENEYPTIRDLYYRGKHTIAYQDLNGRRREENTWDEQKESDSVIQDIEVYTGLLREEMLILSKEKGKVVGNMRIRSGNDVIDLSKLGHGAYAIESTPDLIEILDLDAEFVLVVEKDAVFQQLHRIGFWKRYKAILITGSGQPDRATRRFVRRLNEEHNLPVYIITDSVPGWEPIVALKDGYILAGGIEEFTGKPRGDNKLRVVLDGLRALSWSPETFRVSWGPVAYIYSHLHDGPLHRIRLAGGREVTVTGGHSIYVVRQGKLLLVKAEDVKEGDLVPVIHPSAALALESWWLNSPVSEGYSEAESLGRSLASLSREGQLQRFLVRLPASPPHILAFARGLVARAGSTDSIGNIVLDLDRETGMTLYNLLLLVGVEPKLRVVGARALLTLSKSPFKTPRPIFRYLAIGGDPAKAYLDGMAELKRRGIRRPGARRGTITLNNKYSRIRMATGLRVPPIIDKILRGDVALEPVTEVVKGWISEPVFDISVPGAQTFTAGAGVVVHNSDPYGWYIYSVYKVGSINLSYEGERLTTPKAKFLGVSMTDIFGYRRKKPYLTERERKNFMIKAKDKDIKRAKELLNYKWFRTSKWQTEIKIFLEKKAKLEIEALASKGLKFFAFKYIPEKIETGDWIE